jgi:hypothetical protein
VSKQNARKAEQGTHVRGGSDWKLKFHQARQWENKQKGKGELAGWVVGARIEPKHPARQIFFVCGAISPGGCASWTNFPTQRIPFHHSAFAQA